MSFLKKFTETVSKGVSSATEKAQQTVEITKLHSQISGKKKEIERKYSEIGEAVFEAYAEHDLSRAEHVIIPSCEAITGIRKDIASLESRIRELRNEKECVCGQRVSYDTKFCSTCGHRFDDPIPVAESVEPTPGDGFLPETVQERNLHEADVQPEPEIDVYPGMDDEFEPSQGLEADQPSPRLCAACGLEMPDEARFCQNCGNPMYP